jgi:hypothetical protein
MRLIPILIVASVVNVGAQQPGEPPARGAEMSPAEIQKIFDGYVLAQVQGALGLSEQQFAQVVPRLKALQDTRRRHQQERGRLLFELQRLTRPGPGRGQGSAAGRPGSEEGAIEERLTALQENDARFATDLRRAYDALDEVLDVRQRGRFRIFEEQIERKKLDLLMRARQNPNRPMPRRQPPGR